MRVREFLSLLSETAAKNQYRFEAFRSRMPLGFYGNGEIAAAHRDEKTGRRRAVWITGEKRRAVLASLILATSCLYDEGEACFFILSPSLEYGKLLSVSGADISAPYIRNAEDFTLAVEQISSLCAMRRMKTGYPKLFVVCDGLEEIPSLAENDVTDPYLRLADTLAFCDSELLVSIDLSKSRFSGFPGAAAGIGNCVISCKGEGKADITQVEKDSSLGLPREADCPFEEDLSLAVREWNSLFGEGDA